MFSESPPVVPDRSCKLTFSHAACADVDKEAQWRAGNCGTELQWQSESDDASPSFEDCRSLSPQTSKRSQTRRHTLAGQDVIVKNTFIAEHSLDAAQIASKLRRVKSEPVTARKHLDITHPVEPDDISDSCPPAAWTSESQKVVRCSTPRHKQCASQADEGRLPAQELHKGLTILQCSIQHYDQQSGKVKLNPSQQILQRQQRLPNLLMAKAESCQQVAAKPQKRPQPIQIAIESANILAGDVPTPIRQPPGLPTKHGEGYKAAGQATSSTAGSLSVAAPLSPSSKGSKPACPALPSPARCSDVASPLSLSLAGSSPTSASEASPCDSIIRGALAKPQANQTTIMVRNLSLQYTQDVFLQDMILAGFGPPQINLLYLPFNFRQRTCQGYAIINFVDNNRLETFLETYRTQFFGRYQTLMRTMYASQQGMAANIQRLRRSSLKITNRRYMPVVLEGVEMVPLRVDRT